MGKGTSVPNLKQNRYNLLFIEVAATPDHRDIKKQALCLLANPTIKTDNSITSRHRRLRSTALSFLARWAKRKLSY